MSHYVTNITKRIYLSRFHISINQKWLHTERNSSKRRPLAVTIIAILSIITGIISIVVGLAPLAIGAFVPELSILLFASGGVLIAIGIGYLVVSYGLLKGKGWAWTVTLILSFIGIVFGIISIVGGNFFSIIQLVINVAIVYFLYRPQSKEFFGKPPNAKI